MEQYICIVSPFMTALFSVKDWLVNIFKVDDYLRKKLVNRP